VKSTKSNDPQWKAVDDEFEDVNNLTKEPPQSEYSVALATENFNKNRYENILPPNTSRIVLKSAGYINANLVPGYPNAYSYIATQGPLSGTLDDFWTMVWEQNVSVIIMLAKVIEAGKEKVAQYWPDEKERPLVLGSNTVTLRDVEVLKENTTRIIELKRSGASEKPRVVTHIQYTNWPDHGVPRYTKTFLQLVKMADDMNDTKAPIIVHCSAGVGRTGTFCIVHYLLAKMRLSSPSSINMMDTLLYFRKYRPHMVQSVDQYLFCHRAVAEFFNPPAEEEVKKTSHYQKFEEVRKTVDEPAEFN